MERKYILSFKILVVPFAVLSVQCLGALNSINNAVLFKPVIEQQKSYMKGSIIEPVSFYSQKSVDSPDVIERQGVLKTTKTAPATIVVCHGYMCNKSDIAFLRLMFPNYNVMTFDFRAHGEKRDGQYCTFGRDEALDVMAAVRYLKTRPEVAGKPIIAYGFSMGAASAIEAQARQPLFDAMILDCPFDSTDGIISRAMADMKFKVMGYEFELPGREWLKEYAYTPFVQTLLKVSFRAITQLDALTINTFMHRTSPVTSIEKVDVPCFFITCKNDEKVPVEAVASVYAGAKGYKRFWVTDGTHHYGSLFWDPEQYFYKVNKFVAKVVSGRCKGECSEKIVQDQEVVSQR